MTEPEDPMVRRMRDIMGARWNPLPPGDTEIEPRLVGDGPEGSPDGLGRGDLTVRQKARLDALHGFWLAGYMH